MKTVVISIYFTSDGLGESFAAGVSQLLAGMNIEAAPEASGNHITLIGHEIETMKSLPPSEQEPDELVVAISAPINPLSDIEPDRTETGELIIKSLSSSQAIPFRIDKDVKCSELMVQKLTKMEDQVAFNYLDMSFKFPVAKKEPGEKIDNKDPEFTNTSIRTTIEMSGKTMPVLFKLVDTQSGTPRVIFGSDMISNIKEEPNVKIPT